jgi:hypothetical protein
MEKLEDEITELGFTIREKNVDIRLLKLKLRKIRFLVNRTSPEDCKIKNEILEIIDKEY